MKSTNTQTSLNLPGLVMSGLLALGIALLAFWTFSPRSTDPLSGYSVDRLYNQANAYAHSGKTGLAVLNYERALLLAPADADVQANLHWVRDHAGLSTPASTMAERVVAGWSPNVLAYAGSVGLLLIGSGLLVGSLLPHARWLGRSAWIGGAALVIFAAASAAMTWPKMNEAVVISDASARISPVTNGDVSFKLQEGEVVAVEAEYHDFALVQTDAAHSGWIPTAELSRLVPAGDDRVAPHDKS